MKIVTLEKIRSKLKNMMQIANCENVYHVEQQTIEPHMFSLLDIKIVIKNNDRNYFYFKEGMDNPNQNINRNKRFFKFSFIIS